MNIIISLIHQQAMSPDSMTSLIEVSSLLLRPTTKRETRERKSVRMKRKSVRMRRRDLRVPLSLSLYLPISFTLHPSLCARRLPQRRLSLPQKAKQNKPPENLYNSQNVRQTRDPRETSHHSPKCRRLPHPGSPTQSAGSNNRAATGPSQEGHSQTLTLFEQLLSKTALRRWT